MKVKVKFDLTEIKRKVREASYNTLEKYAQEVVDASQSEDRGDSSAVPEDWGVARHSVTGFVSNDRVAGPGLKNVRGGIKQRALEKGVPTADVSPRRTIPKRSKKNSLNMTVIYSTPYASYIHEIDNTRPGYIERKKKKEEKGRRPYSPNRKPGNQFLMKNLFATARDFLAFTNSFFKREFK